MIYMKDCVYLEEAGMSSARFCFVTPQSVLLQSCRRRLQPLLTKASRRVMMTGPMSWLRSALEGRSTPKIFLGTRFLRLYF